MAACICFQGRVYAAWLRLLQEEKLDIPGHASGKQSRDFDTTFRYCRSEVSYRLRQFRILQFHRLCP